MAVYVYIENVRHLGTAVLTYSSKDTICLFIARMQIELVKSRASFPGSFVLYKSALNEHIDIFINSG